MKIFSFIHITLFCVEKNNIFLKKNKLDFIVWAMFTHRQSLRKFTK